MSKKKNSPTEKEPIVLTEWQKRNLEFLKKKENSGRRRKETKRKISK